MVSDAADGPGDRADRTGDRPDAAAGPAPRSSIGGSHSTAAGRRSCSARRRRRPRRGTGRGRLLMGVISAARPYLPGIAFLAVGAILSRTSSPARSTGSNHSSSRSESARSSVTPPGGRRTQRSPASASTSSSWRPESSCSARRSSSKSSSPRGRPCSGSSSSRSAADSCSRRRSLGVCSGSTGRRPRFLPRARVSAASPRSSRSGACSTRGGSAITFAAATVLLFDAVTLVAFPIAGEWLGLTGRQFGVWAGVSMFSTGPVAAAGSRTRRRRASGRP